MQLPPISCIIVDDEVHARKLLKKYILQSPSLELVGEFSNAAAALKGISGLQPKLIFLDVQMPGQTGIEMLEMLENASQFMIIFTTAYDQYALKAFDKSAIDYLLKPFDEDRFSQAVEKATRLFHLNNAGRDTQTDKIRQLLNQYQLHAPKQENYLEKITCKISGKLKIIYVHEIQAIEADGNYTRALVQDKSFLLDISITDILKRLDPAHFLRIHRSAVVNTKYIVSIEPHFNGEYNVELQNKSILKVSRSYKDDFNRIMGVF